MQILHVETYSAPWLLGNDVPAIFLGLPHSIQLSCTSITGSHVSLQLHSPGGGDHSLPTTLIRFPCDGIRDWEWTPQASTPPSPGLLHQQQLWLWLCLENVTVEGEGNLCEPWSGGPFQVVTPNIKVQKPPGNMTEWRAPSSLLVAFSCNHPAWSMVDITMEYQHEPKHLVLLQKDVSARCSGENSTTVEVPWNNDALAGSMSDYSVVVSAHRTTVQGRSHWLRLLPGDEDDESPSSPAGGGNSDSPAPDDSSDSESAEGNFHNSSSANTSNNNLPVKPGGRNVVVVTAVLSVVGILLAAICGIALLWSLKKRRTRSPVVVSSGEGVASSMTEERMYLLDRVVSSGATSTKQGSTAGFRSSGAESEELTLLNSASSLEDDGGGGGGAETCQSRKDVHWKPPLTRHGIRSHLRAVLLHRKLAPPPVQPSTTRSMAFWPRYPRTERREEQVVGLQRVLQRLKRDVQKRDSGAPQ